MGLIHPSDLDAFRRDEARRQSFARLRRLRAALRGNAGPTPLRLKLGGATPDILLVMDSRAVSCRAAVLDPLAHLPAARVGVLAPFDLDDVPLRGPTMPVADAADLARAVPRVRTVLSAGNHAPGGAAAHDFVTASGGTSVVVQHGMLLPQAAPLPPEVHAVAWSDADAEFWRSGRTDCTMHVLGSQLLHRAELTPDVEIPQDAPPVYVGALHGTELPRLQIERVARQFCLATGASYRPHPSETDLQSRITHLVWKRLGITFETSGLPLVEIAAPIVGMWSTGILEAVAAGRPAWVYHPDPPDWLVEVWRRYELSVWGTDPAPRPLPEAVEPAARLAALLVDLAG